MVESATSPSRPEHATRNEFASRGLATWSARLAAIVLVTFVGAAVLAPFMASDRPLWIRGVEWGRYEAARTSLAPVVAEWNDLARADAHAWNERRPATESRTHAEALAAQRNAIHVRLATLRESLDRADQGPVDEFAARLERARSPEDLDALVADARALCADLRPATGSESDGLRLTARSTFPALSATRPIDAALAAAWLVGVVGFLARRRVRTISIACAVVSVLVGLAWRPWVGRDTGIVSYKAAVERGDYVPESSLCALVPFGPAETNLSEAHRPPTWLESSRRGAGARPAASPGPFDAEPMPVRVRWSEPAVDSPWRHVAGTDSVGRDLVARLVWGARASLFAGFVSAWILTCLGVAIGAWAGWRGGVVDLVTSRVIEVVMCFPAFVLVLCAVFFVDPRVVSPTVAVAFVIGLVGWPHVARLVRAECLRLRELEFVAAARALGLREGTILWRHVLPNALPPAILAFAFAVGSGVLAESALSFLGFAGQADQPSWGALVADSRSPDHAWIWIFPGACIFALAASANFLGEALRDALDPRHGR